MCAQATIASTVECVIAWIRYPETIMGPSTHIAIRPVRRPRFIPPR